jgi:flagellar biosynthesis/type III secretory pathway protein FliH
MAMPADRHDHGAWLRFGAAEAEPASNVVKAADRVRWLELEALRREADVRIEREVGEAVAAATERVCREGAREVTLQLSALHQAFDDAARRMEAEVLNLALEIARRLVADAAPEAFFERALAHLQALVPPGASLRIFVHPQAVDAAAGLARRAAGEGGSSPRHVAVVPDIDATDPLALRVESVHGTLELGAAAYLERITQALAGTPQDGGAG